MLRESTFEAIKTRRQPRGQKPGNKFTRLAPRQEGCTRCGQSPPHGRSQCPAKEAVCHKCHKNDHYKSCCKTRVSIKEVNLDSDDEVFLGVVLEGTTGTKTLWSMEIQLNNLSLEYKVDTGADVTVIPESDYQPERDGKLKPSNSLLSGPTR